MAAAVENALSRHAYLKQLSITNERHHLQTQSAMCCDVLSESSANKRKAKGLFAKRFDVSLLLKIVLTCNDKSERGSAENILGGRTEGGEGQSRT